jgi:hypothetical protein
MVCQCLFCVWQLNHSPIHYYSWSSCNYSKGSLFYSDELDNDNYDILLPDEEQERVGISDEVCFL